MQQPVSKLQNTIPIPQFPPPHSPCVTTPRDSFPTKHCFCVFPTATSAPSNPTGVYFALTTQQIAISPSSPDLSLLTVLPPHLCSPFALAASRILPSEHLCATSSSQPLIKEGGKKAGENTTNNQDGTSCAVFTPLCPAAPGRATGSEKSPERRSCWQPEHHGSFSCPKQRGGVRAQRAGGRCVEHPVESRRVNGLRG